MTDWEIPDMRGANMHILGVLADKLNSNKQSLLTTYKARLIFTLQECSQQREEYDPSSVFCTCKAATVVLCPI